MKAFLLNIDLIPLISIIMLTIIIIIVFLVVMFKYIKRNNDKVNSESINNLVDSLGGILNIEAIDIENRRLKITLLNMKLINQIKLKEVTKGAFVTKNTITIILKENEKEIYNELKLMKK